MSVHDAVQEPMPDVGPGTPVPHALRGWLPHIALGCFAVVMVIVAQAKHISTDDAIATAMDPTADSADRIWAMHLAANRAQEVDPKLGVDMAQAFLSSEDELLREAALLVDLCRHAVRPESAPALSGPPLQNAYAYAPLPGDQWTPHRIRCLILHRRKVGGAAIGGVRRMELAETGWFLGSLAGEPPPTVQEVKRYFKQRARKAGAPPNNR